MFQSVFLNSIINTIYIITVLFVLYLIIKERGEPIRTVAWIMVVVSLPVFGMILYFYFGQNWRKVKIFSRKGLDDLNIINELSNKQLNNLSSESIKNKNIAENIQLVKLLLNNSKALLSKRNKLKILKDGEQTYPEILDAIEKAQQHIHIEYYIFEEGDIANKIIDILIQKARQGVEVRLIYDDVGSWSLRKKTIQKLKHAGIEVESFMPVKFPWLTSKINYRNHRKIIVVDGLEGFIGGINISDKYINGDKRFSYWRDTHLKITGDAVASLQLVFLVDWFFLTRKLENNRSFYFPENSIETITPVQITSSGPDSDWASIFQSYILAISKAKKQVFISTPYFVPDHSILNIIKTSALSGVDVKLIIPAKGDSKVVYWSTLSFIPELIEAGVKIYRYKKGFNHSKILIVDNSFTSIGTANLDERSFHQNFEVNAFVYDENFATQAIEMYKNDLRDSILIDARQWKRRPWYKKIFESLARLLSPLF